MRVIWKFSYTYDNVVYVLDLIDTTFTAMEIEEGRET